MQIKTNYEQIYQTSNVLKEKASAYGQCIDQIQVKMQDLQSSWQGEDHRVFLEQVSKFQPELKKLQRLIETYAQVLYKSALMYEQLQLDRIQQARRLL